MAVLNQEIIELVLKVSGTDHASKAVNKFGGVFSDLGDPVS